MPAVPRHPATLRDPRLLARLTARTDGSNEPDTLLARELARYYGLLARELAGLELSPAEANLLYMAVLTTRAAARQGEPVPGLAAAVAEHWQRSRNSPSMMGANGERLAESVAAWCPGRTLAVWDAYERPIILGDRPDRLDFRGMARAVGLLRDQTA